MCKNSKPFHLLVCFTYGVSLKIWDKTGLIGRETLLYEKMVAQGNTVTFLTFGGKEDERYIAKLPGINIVPVYCYVKKSKNKWINFLNSFLIPLRFHQFFKDANVIKTNQMYGAWVPIFASILFKKKLIVRCGYEMLRNLLRDEPARIMWWFKGTLGYLLELLAYMSAYKIVITNRADMKFITACFPVNYKKINIIRNFIDTDNFAPKRSLIKNNRQILFIGRLDQRKNIANLIKAVANSGNCLDIIGEGNQKDFLKKITEDMNAKVNFLGVFDNSQLPEIINNYRFFILSSLYENNPKTLLEAMSCARVVIGTKVDGIRELIDDGITGFLCDTNVASIQAVIEKVTTMDSEKLNFIADNSRQFVISECSMKKIYSQETGIYE